jgi:hypothetical protein
MNKADTKEALKAVQGQVSESIRIVEAMQTGNRLWKVEYFYLAQARDHLGKALAALTLVAGTELEPGLQELITAELLLDAG